MTPTTLYGNFEKKRILMRMNRSREALMTSGQCGWYTG